MAYPSQNGIFQPKIKIEIGMQFAIYCNNNNRYATSGT
jgi:hypothetical protein